jgi:F0F1-type ATP synthase assembly protein I
MNFFQRVLQKAAPIMSAVQSLFFYVIIFSLVGYYADQKFDTFPFIFLPCLLFGLAFGFYQIYVLVNFKNKD